MFCPSCGNENTGLPYCNRCGANLTTLTPQPQIVEVNITKPALILAITLAVVTLGGFGGLIGGALRMAEVLHGDDGPMAIIFFGMVTILVIDIFLVRQLSKIISAALASAQPRAQRMSNPSQAPLHLQQQPVVGRFTAASVTEHTTRFFEPSNRPTSETDKLASAPNPHK